MRKLKQGILLTVEGIDGSGKSTLANNLRDKLKKDNFDILLTYEPGDTPLGKKIRAILHSDDVAISGESEFLLFASDRAQHFKDVIIPNLKKNKLIISDRMADSSAAYQGYGRQINIEMIHTINKWVMRDIVPDITLYIKVPLEVALQRLKKRKTKPTSFEKEKEAFTKRLIHGYDEIFKDRKNVIIVDGEQSAEILAKIAYANVKEWLKNKKFIAP